jgi:hypothetical protein
VLVFPQNYPSLNEIKAIYLPTQTAFSISNISMQSKCKQTLMNQPPFGEVLKARNHFHLDA